MIKQSQICNFASLIKTLRKQRSSPSLNTFKSKQNNKNNTMTNITAQKSTRTLNQYKCQYKEQQKQQQLQNWRGSHTNKTKRRNYHRHNKTSQGVIVIQQNSQAIGLSVQNQFSDDQFQRNFQVFKKKKAFQVYCEEKKKKLARFQTISLHKFSQLTCDGISFVQYSRKSNKKAGQSHQKMKNMKVQTDQDIQLNNTNENKLQNLLKNKKVIEKLPTQTETQSQKQNNMLIQKSKSRLSCKTFQKFTQIPHNTSYCPTTMKNIPITSLISSSTSPYRPPSFNTYKNSANNREILKENNNNSNSNSNINNNNKLKQCWVIQPWENNQTQCAQELIVSPRYV